MLCHTQESMRFLNLLNLKTGIKDEDGYSPKPFEQNSPEQSVEEPTYTG